MKIFWAWQYDLKAKIARTFIREALEEAIKQLNQQQDIEEPDESFQTSSIELDYGRKNLSGSPDLAIEILKKIDASSVFVGDVTPVGKTEEKRNDEGTVVQKLLMNSNVAIELGYALKSLGTDRILMIMNSHYGKRADMPFDLGHKGGPIMYALSPDASREEMEVEKKKLVAVLGEALGYFIPKAAVAPFEELKPQIGKGLFFKDGEVLGENKNGPDKGAFVMPFRRVAWLRVIPNQAMDMPLSVQTLRNNAGRFGAFGSPIGMEAIRENKYGVIFFSPAGNTNNIDNLTQYTRDGEVWGVNADYLRQGEQGERRYVYSINIENLFITSLGLYCDYMRDIVKAPLPIQVEAGIEGIKGCELLHHGMVIGAPGVMHHDRIVHRGLLRTYDAVDQDKFLKEFLQKLHANTGHVRPAKLYGRW